MSDVVTCPICTMPEPLEAVDGFECATCGHEWTPDGDAALGVIVDANGTTLASGDTVVVIKDLKVDGKVGGIKVGTKIKSIRLVAGDHEIDAKVNGRALLVKAEFVKKA